jgi:CubicO group peptidase (beta-lactamase class C family)
MQRLIILLAIVTLAACKKNTTTNTPPPPESYYYPAIASDVWETKTPASLGWDEAKLQAAIDYAASVNTYGLLILHNGKIVTEKYWNGWDYNTIYPIASAGKSVTSFLIGIAQQDGLVNINDKTSQYLGAGWTSLPPAKENLITLKHQLSMTTGLDDNVTDENCLTPACLTYKADAGTRWAYHNAPYRLLQNVVANASNITFTAYTKNKLADKIGLKNYTWLNHILYLNTRDMARFGSLALQKGVWNNTALLTDQNYFSAMTNTSNTYNQSYGYLWWLNGKSSFMVPTIASVFSGALVPSAPADMVSCLGKGDKKIYVVPSLNLVVVRQGNDTGTNTLGPSSFDEFFWSRLKQAIKY